MVFDKSEDKSYKDVGKDVVVPNKPLEEMTIEELQKVILDKMGFPANYTKLLEID